MAKKKKQLYPNADYRPEVKRPEEEPDFIPGTMTPNYDKFTKWPVEKLLAWLNID